MTRGGSGRPSIRVGTRGSALALAQSGLLARQLERATGRAVELVVVKTSGDRLATVSLSRIGGKGLFVKELEDALEQGLVDLAIHSLKDVPAVLPSGFALVATPARGDPADVIVGGGAEEGLPGAAPGEGSTAGAFRDDVRRLPALAGLRPGARVGTGSLRRRAQLAALRPDVVVVPLRGNVDTRLRRQREGAVDAVVLAAAGLERLGLDRSSVGAARLDPAVFLPAPAQGILAMEARAGDAAAADVARSVHDIATELAAAAERAFLRSLGASCTVPIAALARAGAAPSSLRLEGLVSTLDGTRLLRDEIEGSVAGPADAERLGASLGELLLQRGARAILAEAERAALALGDPV